MLKSEAMVRSGLKGNHYAPPLDFGGTSSDRLNSNNITAIPTKPPDLVIAQDEATAPSAQPNASAYRKPGDPPPAVPGLSVAWEVILED